MWPDCTRLCSLLDGQYNYFDVVVLEVKVASNQFEEEIFYALRDMTRLNTTRIVGVGKVGSF